MAASVKGRTPGQALQLSKEMSNKLFSQDPKASNKPLARNPITQDDIEVKNAPKSLKSPVFLYAEPKSQGIAMGVFASQSKKSDIFGVADSPSKASRKYIPHSGSETYIPTVSLKKSEWQPPSRNPITQDTIPDYAPVIRTKCSQSTAFSHLFDERTEEHRPRDNI